MKFALFPGPQWAVLFSLVIEVIPLCTGPWLALLSELADLSLISSQPLVGADGMSTWESLLYFIVDQHTISGWHQNISFLLNTQAFL